MQIIRKGKGIIMNPHIHKRTLLWFHGLGDTAEDYFTIFSKYQILKDCRLILLTAPLIPVTEFSGQFKHAWYDVNGPCQNVINPKADDCAENIVKEILVQKETCDEIYIGGVSQGGSLALYIGLAYMDMPVHGIIGVSCYAMNYFIKEKLEKTPVFLYHGENDKRVPLAFAQNSYETYLKSVNYTFKVEKRLGHAVSRGGLNNINAWAESLYIKNN